MFRRRKKTRFLKTKVHGDHIRMFALRPKPTPVRYDRSVPARYESYLAEKAQREAEAAIAAGIHGETEESLAAFLALLADGGADGSGGADDEGEDDGELQDDGELHDAAEGAGAEGAAGAPCGADACGAAGAARDGTARRAP